MIRREDHRRIGRHVLQSDDLDAPEEARTQRENR